MQWKAVGGAVLVACCGACAPDPPVEGGASGEHAHLRGPFPEHLPRIEHTGSQSFIDADERLEVTLELGGVDAPEVLQFGEIAAIQVDSGGTIFVIDGHAQHVKSFSPDGRHLATLGGRGEGPGEFQAAIGMAFDSDGALWVVDPVNTRYTDILSDQVPPRSIPRRVSGLGLPWSGTVDKDDRILDWGVEPVLRPVNGMPLPGPVTRLPLMATSTRDGSTDTFPSMARFTPTVGRSAHRIPFAGIQTYAVAADGTIWFAKTARYEIAKRTLHGDTLLVVSRPDAPLEPVSLPELRDSIARLKGRLVEDYELDPSDAPQNRPVMDRMIITDSGHLIVFLIPYDGSAGTADVFEHETGSYVGSLRMPYRIERSVRPVARHGHLYAVVEDALDVERVVRIRLPEVLTSRDEPSPRVVH